MKIAAALLILALLACNDSSNHAFVDKTPEADSTLLQADSLKDPKVDGTDHNIMLTDSALEE